MSETFQIGNLTVHLIQDIHPENPREDYDHLGHMACWHRRYMLGDEHDFDDPEDLLGYLIHEALTPDERDRRDHIRDLLDRIRDLLDHIPGNYINHTWGPKADFMRCYAWLVDQLDALKEQALTKYVLLPLYLMDHSGLTISTEPFSCTWDSGQVGWIYMTMEQARKNWPGYTDAEARASAERALINEVAEYDAYLRGDVWGYTITDEHGDELDSYWGFYGLEDARASATVDARTLAETRPAQLEMSL